jgi:hypothetical protein
LLSSIDTRRYLRYTLLRYARHNDTVAPKQRKGTRMRHARPILLALLLLALAPIAAHAQPDQRCFPETGQCIAGPIRAYWERNGGLAVFGFPITAQAAESVEGTPLQVQWFERDRLEIQPNGTVTAGRLGVERLEQLGTPWQQAAPPSPRRVIRSAARSPPTGAPTAAWSASASR